MRNLKNTPVFFPGFFHSNCKIEVESLPAICLAGLLSAAGGPRYRRRPVIIAMRWRRTISTHRNPASLGFLFLIVFG